MKDYKLILKEIDQVKPFIEATSLIECDIDLVCGRYIIDAKSMLGIFTLDLSKDILLRIHESDEKLIGEIEQTLAPYIQVL